MCVFQRMVSSSSSSEAVEAVLGIVAKGNAILAEISRLAEVLMRMIMFLLLMIVFVVDDCGKGQRYTCRDFEIG